MYLHLTQVHSHLRLWSEATDSLTWGSGCPHRTLTCCWRVPFTSQARTYPSHGRLAASVGTPGGSSVLQSAAEHSLDFLIYLFPHFFSSQSTSRWLCAQIVRLCLFWWESCIPLYSSSPPALLLLDRQSHPAPAGADSLTPFPRGQAIPSEQPLPPPSRKSGYLLRFSAQRHPPESLSLTATWPRPLTTPSFCPWWAVTPGTSLTSICLGSALHPATRLRFSTTCTTGRPISD